MATLSGLQRSAARARDSYAKADDAHYAAAQKWALTGEGETELERLRRARDETQVELSAAIAAVAALGGPAELVDQTPADTPFLLFPVRLEVRYLLTRHVTRDLSPEDVVDVSSLGLPGAGVAAGFEEAGDGGAAWRVPSLETLRLPAAARASVEAAATRVPSGRLLLRQPDRDELWIRIYPDEVFTELRETHLTAAEAEAGRAFWREAWTGGEEEAWLRLVDGTTVPRAGWIMLRTRPTNWSSRRTRGARPRFPTVPLKDGPFTRAPVARLLPERFVARLSRGDVVKEFVGALVPEPLPLGLDPASTPLAAEDADAFRAAGAVLRAPEALRWVHDLEAAERAGLAIRVDLSQHPEFREGVDSVVVLGAKLSADAEEGGRLLGRHLEQCVYKEQGLAVLRQGTATNRAGTRTTPEERAADARRYFRSLWEPDTEPGTDGARLRRALGLDEEAPVPDGESRDVDDALLVNGLLWPATFGYYLLQFFTPLMGDAVRERVRGFFTRRVSGRGLLPVLRVNSQPYGIVPTTSFAHWTYGDARSDDDRFLAALWTSYLSPLSAQWNAMLPRIDADAAAAAAGHRLDEAFLSAVGTSASSVRLERQLVVGAALQEIMQLVEGSVATTLRADRAFDPSARAAELTAAGLDAAQYQALVASYVSPREIRGISAPLVDGVPLSDERELQRLPGKALNYLDWLAAAKLEEVWTHDLSGAPAGDGPAEGNPGADTVLAKLCRQALLRTYLESGLRRAEPDAGLWLIKARDFETERLHEDAIAVDPGALAADNLLHRQYAPLLRQLGITAPFSLEPDHWRYLEPIADTLARPTGEARTALGRLARLPTAQLRRLLTEHLDLCSHRLDAWLLGLLHERLERQRAARATGIGLGAFGMLLDLRPAERRAIRILEVKPERVAATAENVPRAAVPVADLRLAREREIRPDRGWDRVYFYLGEQPEPGTRLDLATGSVQPAPATNQASSQGFLHAPSPTQATAAAILYAGHLSHRREAGDDSLAIRLDPRRTRIGLELLQGMQEGASLAELLGHRLERAIHERGLDSFLFDIRGLFPLRQAPGERAAHALVTTDGLAVIEAQRASPVPAVVTSIAPAVRDIEEMLDAVGDLLLAESVFQASKGNPDRAAAALRTLNSGGQVVPPELVRTSPRGVVINHKVAVVLPRLAARERAEVWSRDRRSARASLAPALNHWLARQLPAPADIAIGVRVGDGPLQPVTVEQLGLEPIELLRACPETFESPERSLLAAAAALTARERLAGGDPAAEIGVDFRGREGLRAAQVTVYELAALVTSLRKLVAECRPLDPGDFRPPGTRGGGRPPLDLTRATKALKALGGTRGPIATAAGALRKAAKSFATVRPTRAAELRRAAERLRAAMLGAALDGGVDVDLRPDPVADRAAALAAAQAAATELDRRRAALAGLLRDVPGEMGAPALLARLVEAASAVFGGAVPVVPEVQLENADEVDAALDGRSRLEHASPDEVDRWLGEAALVRPSLRSFRRAVLLRELLGAEDAGAAPHIVQLPFHADRQQPWVGGPFSPDSAGLDQALSSLALELPDGFSSGAGLSGLVVDEWPEFVPSRVADTAAAVHYNQPDSEPPQTLLLAVSPVGEGTWRWEHLTGAVQDALRLAKQRLVTPAHIAAHNAALGQLLPAIMLPVTPGGNQIPNVEIG